MAKKFLFSVLLIVGINFCYKAISYFSYKTTKGVVIGYYDSSELFHYANGNVRKEERIKPIIEYSIDGIKYTESQKKWGGLCLPDINEKITLLYKDDKSNPELFRFFQYWFTLTTFIVVLLGSIFLTIFIELIAFYIKKS